MPKLTKSQRRRQRARKLREANNRCSGFGIPKHTIKRSYSLEVFLPSHIVHAIHEFLRISTVLSLRSVCKPWQVRINEALRSFRWNIKHIKGVDIEPIAWLTRMYNVRVNIKSICMEHVAWHLKDATSRGNVNAVELLVSLRQLSFDPHIIFHAASKGHCEIFKILLNGIDVNINATDHKKKTMLHHAVEQSRNEIVKEIISVSNVDYNAADANGETALHYACARGNLEVVRSLVVSSKGGVNINATDSSQMTPAMHAAKRGQNRVIEYLLTLTGLRVNATCKYGDTALHKAIEQEHLNVFKCLDIRRVHKYIGNFLSVTPLHLAAERGLLYETKRLLESRGVNPSATTADGDTPLHVASGGRVLWYGRHCEVIKLLLKIKSVDVNVRNNRGETPLHRAIRHRRAATAKLLLRRKDIEINATTINGETPLHYSLVYNPWYDHETIHTRLMAFSIIDAHIPDVSGKTPLHYAAEKGMLSILEHFMPIPVLSANGNISGNTNVTISNDMAARINATDLDGKTLLHYAATATNIGDYDNNIRIRVVKHLLSFPEIDYNAKDSDGKTALYYAAEEQCFDVIEHLTSLSAIEIGSALQVRDVDGNTLLCSAVRRGNMSAIRLLLSLGEFDLNAVNHSGDTALHIGHRSLSIVKLLVSSPGVDISAKNTDGLTALHLAAWSNRLDVVKFFVLQCGMDPNDETPLTYDADQKELISFLKSL